eukprot:2340474-Pleurochrysis_carterae.AAC.3
MEPLGVLRQLEAFRDAHLGARLHGLHHVQVHLVAVEVGVVRRGDGEVHAEGGVGHDLDARRLAVEHDDVAVLDVTLYLVAVCEGARQDALGACG